MRRIKVAVAMSGGVDSSVTAALLREKEYDVFGITMNIFPLPKKRGEVHDSEIFKGPWSVEDANRAARMIGISHTILDLQEVFEKKVVEYFCEEYVQGRTPNPCIRCNQDIKFKALMEKAQEMGADYLATGHYARIVYDSKVGRSLLKKGKDREKDQSYFLYPLTQDQLSHTLMPIGDFTKKEVKELAERYSLPATRRLESQEICFIPDNDYGGFLQRKIPDAFHSGSIINLEGKILGQHRGIAHYTIGQRRGMKIAAPHPLYVISIRSEENTIVVGPKDELYEKALIASHVNLISVPKIMKPLPVKAKIRYKHKEAKALLTPINSKQLHIEFEKLQRAITPGQSVVFYDGEVVVGGGVIDKIGT